MEGRLFQKYLYEIYVDAGRSKHLGVGDKYQIMKKAREWAYQYLRNPQGPESGIQQYIKDFKKYFGGDDWKERILISDAVTDSEKWYGKNMIDS